MPSDPNLHRLSVNGILKFRIKELLCTFISFSLVLATAAGLSSSPASAAYSLTRTSLYCRIRELWNKEPKIKKIKMGKWNRTNVYDYKGQKVPFSKKAVVCGSVSALIWLSVYGSLFVLGMLIRIRIQEQGRWPKIKKINLISSLSKRLLYLRKYILWPITYIK